jgi:hypothetical protein
MANALLTEQGALGYVTELLSGDFNAAFGRSSHHQVWSEAMVITPLIRGMLGIEVLDAGATLRLKPQLPADWDRVAVQRIAAGAASFDVSITRAKGRVQIEVLRPPQRGGGQGAGTEPRRLVIAPAFPLDAEVRAVRVDGRSLSPTLTTLGDVRFAEIEIPAPQVRTIVEYTVQDGSDVYVRRDPAAPGNTPQGVRILRSRAEAAGLRLTLEGRSGRTYSLGLRTPRSLATFTAPGLRVQAPPGQDMQVLVTFEGPEDQYVRREVLVPLSPPSR